MAKAIINLTLPIVVEAIEDVLEVYPQADRRNVLATKDARQELIAYVLSRFPSTYAVVEDQQLLESITTPYCSQEQRMKLEALIHQGIQYYCHHRDKEDDYGRNVTTPNSVVYCDRELQRDGLAINLNLS